MQRHSLWAGWSASLDGITGQERNADGSWSCWTADWAADIQITEFEPKTLVPMPLVQRVLDQGGESIEGKGWQGAALTMMERDASTGKNAYRYATTLVAGGTTMSCWVSYLDADHADEARTFVQAIEHDGDR